MRRRAPPSSGRVNSKSYLFSSNNEATAIPKAFRGLPITLVYIGVLALAIYGFTGHSVIL